jgi:hypothetical protein
MTLVPGSLITQAMSDNADVEAAFAACDVLLKIVTERRAALRETIAAKHATGTKVLVSGGAVAVSHQTRPIDEKSLRAILAARGLEESAAFTQVAVLKIDESKIDALVAVGRLEEAAVKACRPVIPTVSFKPDPALKAGIEDAVEALKGRSPRPIVKGAPSSAGKVVRR